MQTNKYQLERYRILGDLLTHAPMCADELTAELNRRLEDKGFALDKPVSRRTVLSDLARIEELFGVEITSERSGHKVLKSLRGGQALFSRKFSDDEAAYLRELLAVTGHFEGLAEFEAVNSLRKELSVEGERHRILDFGFSGLQGRFLPELFSHIRRRDIITVDYVTNADAETVRRVELKPYLLKQYEGHWSLVGADVRDDFILSFPLGHIRSVGLSFRGHYRDIPVSFRHYYDNVTGVSVPSGRAAETVVLWADVAWLPFLERKPFHRFMSEITEPDKCGWLRRDFPELPEGGSFFAMECVVNQELIQLILSCSEKLCVLSPSWLRAEIRERIRKMNEIYG